MYFTLLSNDFHTDLIETRSEHDFIKDILDDATLIATSLKQETGRTIEIIISEGTREDDSMEPFLVSSI
jgi:hypothetical protein